MLAIVKDMFDFSKYILKGESSREFGVLVG
jgi:hypothetical protein